MQVFDALFFQTLTVIGLTNEYSMIFLANEEESCFRKPV